MYTKDFGDFGASLAFSRPKTTSPFSTLLRNVSSLTGGKVIRTEEPAEPVQVMPTVKTTAPAPAITIMPISTPANPTGLKSIVSAAASGAVVPPINVGSRSDPIYVPAPVSGKMTVPGMPGAPLSPATQAAVAAANWEKVKQGISPTIRAPPATAPATPVATATASAPLITTGNVNAPAAAPALVSAQPKAGGGLVGPAAGAAAGFLVGGPIGAAVGAAAMFMLSKK